MSNVIRIGEGKFEQIWQKRCQHKHLTYDITERIVQCKDCKRVVDGFEAFMIAVRFWQGAETELKRRQEDLAELEKKANIGLLKASRKVDHAWRSKNMVPSCPHCHEAIFPEDGLGSDMINKQMAIQMRKFKNKRLAGKE